MKLNDSWQRLPEARVRMTDNGHLKHLVDGLTKNGTLVCDKPKIRLDKEGVYISLFTNAGIYPSVVPVEVEVLIPIDSSMIPKGYFDDTKPEVKVETEIKAQLSDIVITDLPENPTPAIVEVSNEQPEAQQREASDGSDGLGDENRA